MNNDTSVSIAGEDSALNDIEESPKHRNEESFNPAADTSSSVKSFHSRFSSNQDDEVRNSPTESITTLAGSEDNSRENILCMHDEDLLNLASFEGQNVYNDLQRRRQEREQRLEELFGSMAKIFDDLRNVVECAYLSNREEIEQQFEEGFQRVQQVEYEQDRLRKQISSFIEVVGREYAKIFNNRLSSN